MTTQKITVQGIEFTAPAPYAQGHALNENEARALNQLLGENLRNNFASKVKKALEAAKADGGREELNKAELHDLHTGFGEYAKSYEFSQQRTPAAKLDPVEKEARKLGKAMVLAGLAKKNIDPKSLAEGKLDSLIDQVLERKPEVRAEAKRRLNATAKAATDALEGIEI